MSERWLPVVGFEGLYSVSDEGRIRSDRTKTGSWSGRILRQSTVFTGHRRICLCKDNTLSMHFVHRLILTAFVGPPGEGMECRHLNGDPADNHIQNLSWGTAKENALDRDRHGRTARGERHGLVKLARARARQ